MPESRLIVLTAGGTGGHVFPAEALAGELARRGFRLALITDRRGHAYRGALADIPTHRIRAGGIAGRGVLSKAWSLAEIVVGTVQARGLLRRLRPAAVVGFGGYASVPAVLAATRLGIPAAVHEQNAVLGRANRLLARGASRIATSFTATPHAGRAVVTGMPVRPPVAALAGTPYPAFDGPLRLVVIGGSQGARILSEVVPAALARLPEDLRQRIHISQQCRPEDLEAVRAAYAGSGVAATLESFFADIPERLAAAHLVIARSGSSTVAELQVIGRPAILVPYPFATDDHQTANARAVEAAGGGWLMPQPEFTAEALAGRLAALLSSPETLGETAARARAAGMPDAAARLADLVEDIAEVRAGGQS